MAGDDEEDRRTGGSRWQTEILSAGSAEEFFYWQQKFGTKTTFGVPVFKGSDLGVVHEPDQI